MKKYIVVLFSLIFLNIYSQELSIPEAINYINTKFKGGRKLELTEGGKLKIYELRPDYFFDNLVLTEMQKRQESNNYKMIALYSEEISIHEINIENKDFVGNGYTYGDFLFQIKCNYDKKGCSKYKKYDKNGEIRNTESRNIINISNPDRDNNDKLFNAFRYLISLAKHDKKYQENDSDPFSSKNHNKTFEVISKKDKDQIRLNNENGVYKINVEFGSITKSFVLDSRS
ncbi:hypothetical protein N7U66_04930 [Lacinutrix neustonica]|uniref:Uncharacterized protein n=1 Tax=Lacinutrix neustonica TaxID=2980107 RepID=A0A9E8SHR2_9FLAO|nr:hypothetical protein [Lacinutrix neustonica]WAC02975.1 hypothetical protein N7U66_04930 [Lacinutrix neustonica]